MRVGRNRIPLALLSAMLMAAGAAVWYRAREQSRPAGPGRASERYVDPAACAGCHAEIARTYRLTGMGRSFYRLTPANTVERPGVFRHDASERVYTMSLREGQLYQRRHQIGFEDRETNVVEKRAGYVIGS